MLCFVTLNIFALLICQCASSELPSYFPKCDLDDPELDICLLDATEELKPYMQKGIPEAKLPELGPLFIQNFVAEQRTSLLNYTGSFSNCTITGLDDYHFQQFRYNPETKTFDGNVEFEAIVLNCHYELHGGVLSFPLEGEGSMTVGLYDTNAAFQIKGNLRKRKGVVYYNPTTTTIRGTIQDGSYKFNGLFGGNEELSQTTNRLLNLNSKLITQEATRVLEVLAESGVHRMMKSFTNTIPYNELFSRSHKVQ